MSKLDDKLSKFVGSNMHDLSKVVVGDILVRDVYNNGGFNGCFNAVTIDKKLRTIMMSDGSSVDFEGKNKSGLGCYRLPKDDEIEKETNVALWRRLSFFDYEFLPKDMLIRLNNILDNYLDRRNQRRVEMKSRAENTNSTEIRTTKNNVQERRTFDDKPKRSWSTIAKTLANKEEQTWKKKNKIKKSKHKR